MLLKILWNYLLGYLNINVEGYFIERFINVCISKNILLWNTKRQDSIMLTTNIGMRDFKKIRKIAKTTKCKVKINSKKGIPYLMNKYRKRKIFAIFLMLILLSFIVLSNFVWNIDIIVDGDISKADIMQSLENEGLKVGKWKKQIDTKKIINNVRLNRDDIAWMGISLKGTNAIVEIQKNKEKPEIIDVDDYCNIISDKAGVITKINVQNGTPLVKVGDIVKNGTPLVGGWLEGKYTGIRYVHGTADIEARVWYSKKEKFYLNQQIQVDTGNTEKKHSININNFKINFYKTLSKFKKYDTINETKKMMLFSNFYLPIEWTTIINYEQKEKNVVYTENEAIDSLTKKLEEEIKLTIKDENSIINKQINTYKGEGYVEVELIYEVLENIGVQEKIIS